MSEFLVVTGMSGAGRSTAAAALEDLGLVRHRQPAGRRSSSKMAEMVAVPGSEIERVALVIGRGGGDGPSTSTICPRCSTRSRAGAHRVRVLFLDAARRRPGPPLRGHAPAPSAAARRGGGVDRRRARAARAGARPGRPADRHRGAQLEPAARPGPRAFGDDDGAATMQTSVVSFGYKHGIPLDVDLVFDCRFLPNPYWVEELRPLQRARRAGARLRPRPARDDRTSWRRWTTC